MGGPRTYRVLLPPGYAASKKRYPVIYWFYGYEQPNQAAESEAASYVASHELLLVSAGTVETAHATPARVISSIRWPIRPSCTGAV